MDSSLLPKGPIKQGLLADTLEQAGQAANQAAALHRFGDYRSRRSMETIRRQDADLTLFAEFLYTAGVQAGSLGDNPQSWKGVTWGLVEAFVKWQLKEGYAVSSVNVRLSTIKTYARLAFQAGILQAEEYATIRAVQGYSQREKRRIDAQRSVRRVGLKKEFPVPINPNQALALKNQPAGTLREARDRLLVCMLLDHGLRVGEVAALRFENIDLGKGMIRFFRPKVAKAQTHRLSPDAFDAAQQYLHLINSFGMVEGPLFRRIKRNGQPAVQGLTGRGISLIVCELGRNLGLAGLSAHDCRHYWATTAAHNGTDPFSLQEAGGWSSLAMPRRYIDDAIIANQGIKTTPENDQTAG